MPNTMPQVEELPGYFIGATYGPGIRSKFTHPYSYDPFTIWRREGKPPGNTSGIYSDRLLSWDYAKHDQLCLKHFGNQGQYWGNRSPALIEKFLQDWHNDPSIKLWRIIESCDLSNGYPVWCFICSMDVLDSELTPN